MKHESAVSILLQPYGGVFGVDRLVRWWNRDNTYVLIDNNEAEVAVNNLLNEVFAPRAMAMAA
jgi:hypothetical protein